MNRSITRSKIALLSLLVVCLFQSCKAYDTDSAPQQEAIDSELRVKVLTVDGSTYKFKKLIIEDQQLIGLTNPNSKAAKLLPSKKFVDAKGRELEKVAIDNDTIKEINVYDKKKSTRKTVFLVVGITLGIVIIAGIAAAAVVVVAA
jgi:hypothetical protein